ncbi:MAG: class I SAM-dependent rRNA methyltransferase [Spirochaetes bacterium]|nr:class I SAM-dependent rRNA methyltransferase [Spirochaetota bacterium]
MKSIVIHENRKKSVMNRHPWIYSGSIKSADKNISDGEIIRAVTVQGEFLCYGFYNSRSKITVRAFCWEEKTIPDENYLQQLVKNSVAKRAKILTEETDCCRLVFSESDFLPGVIADFYNGFISASFNTASAQLYKKIILDALVSETDSEGFIENTSSDFLKKEGISEIKNISGGSIPDFIQIRENGIIYDADIIQGQKTGFYADQRSNRRIASGEASEKTVLDVFSYSGGFTLNALKNNAMHVTSIDSSSQALDRLKSSMSLNGFSVQRQTSIQGDAFQTLRNLQAENRKYDLIILDPPKLAPSRHSLNDALKAYKEINLSAMRLASDNGIIFIFSCSQAVNIETLKEVVRWAAVDAGRDVFFLRYLSQPEDHPVLATFPESEYLKGIMYSVI